MELIKKHCEKGYEIKIFPHDLQKYFESQFQFHDFQDGCVVKFIQSQTPWIEETVTTFSVVKFVPGEDDLSQSAFDLASSVLNSTKRLDLKLVYKNNMFEGIVGISAWEMAKI
jgi:hypothetical protein